MVAQVSTAALNILDTTELLQRVVDLTKERFGLYHAHIYLLDEISQTLILAAGAGEVGRKMVAEGWSIPLKREQSLVAGAARTRQGVIVNDVRVAPDWLPNPLLPDTRSELAVPLIASGRVLGVLDVQSEEEGHFTGDDIRIQTTLAAQIAVALENARLFEQAEKADTLLHERVKELDCLNDIGREMEENPPPLPELLQWITERIPPAMRYPELSVAAIEFDGQVYGVPEAIELPSQITHGLYVGGQVMGRIYIGHTEDREFIDEESALLGGIATRVSGFIENQRLLEQTQQRATELEDTTTFLNSIVENIPVMLFVKDAEELRFVRWNRAGEEIVGMTREQMFGKNDYDFFPKEEADFFTAKDREVLNSGELVDIPEEPIQTADKGTRYLHTTKIPVYGPDGKPRYLLGISEDITERKQAASEQERLLADIRRLAAIVENHPDFIGVGTLDGRALYVNPAGLRMMGLPPDHDVTTMDASDFYPAEDAEKLLKQGVPTALEKGSWNTEANLLKADGTTVPVEETASINYDREGNPASFSITMHDITNRKVAAAEQARLLAEVESSYRQYVRQEWEQYLQEHHQGRWHIEYQQHNVDLETSPEWLAKIQEAVLQAGETRVIKESGDNGEVKVSAGDGRQTAAIVAPIALRGQVIGTLNLQDLARDRNWTNEEIALVEAVSEQLGLTVENLRLFDDTQRTATREQLTRQITDRMRAAPDVDSIIQTGLTELAKALQVSRTYVKLTTPSGQEE
jgi:PAS domain S-box-containing protein